MSESSSSKDLFLEALDLPEEERRAFVEARCRGDHELRDRVLRLLSAREGASWLEEGVERLVEVDARPEFGPVHQGAQLGPYELLERLGQGGMAVVWRARQSEPVKRDVAIKILRGDVFSSSIGARFEAERQALAWMDHPNISRMFDVGTLDDGRPWFAMELIAGDPITSVCRERRLDLRTRLELFREVAHAVQHAHQKGVVHRDIKPANVLVAELDGALVPKVIDFGVAKAMDRRLTDSSVATLDGELVGTPAYMSPEQVAEAGDIDTRTDVYSLGVLLYELLCDEGPFGEETRAQLGLVEVLRLVREVDPPRPSARLAARDAHAARALRGDLDWVVLACLEKERDRRYASVALLADDIERYLAGEPVHARPPDFRYRLSKFVARHRLATTLAVTAFVLLVGGIAVSTTQLVRARAAEQRLSREVEQTAIELGRFRATSVFLEELLLGIDPSQAQGQDTTVLRDLLERATARVEQASEGRPEVEASLRRAIGLAHQQIADYAEAEVQLSRAYELRASALPEGHEDLARSSHDLGSLFAEQGRFEEAVPLLERAIAARMAQFGGGDDEALSSLGNLAACLRSLERWPEAETLHRKVLAIWLERGGEEAEGTIRAMNNLALLLRERGETEEPRELFTRALELQRRVQGSTHPDTLKALNNLAQFYASQGESESAIELLYEALDAKRQILDPGHPSLLISLSNLARLRTLTGDSEGAQALYREGLAALDDSRPAAHETEIMFRTNYAGSLEQLGELDAALEYYEHALRDALALSGSGSSLHLTIEGRCLDLLLQAGSVELVPDRAATAAALASQTYPQSSPIPALFRIREGLARCRVGEQEAGRPLLEQALSVVEAAGLEDWEAKVREALEAHPASD